MYRVWNVSLVRVLLIPDCKQQHAEVRFSLSSYRFDLPLTTFLRGETEKTAQTADAADGLYNQIAGTANELMGQVMGDSTKEASGELFLAFPLHVPALPRFFHPTLPSSSSTRPFDSTTPCSHALTPISRQGARNRQSGQEGG
jgi:hypothetical protein